MIRLTGLLCLLVLLAAVKAFAGTAPAAADPVSYLTLTVVGAGLTGEWKVPVAELAAPLGLPGGELPDWEQLEGRGADIKTLLRAHLKVSTGAVPLEFRFTQLQYGTQDRLPRGVPAAAFLLRETRFYRTGVIYGGSAVAAVLALVWFIQRAFF